MLRSTENRRKPLRTYGRQQVPTTEDATEPRATKRRRVSEAGDVEGDANTSTPVHTMRITKESVSATKCTKTSSSPAAPTSSSTKQQILNLPKTAELTATQPTLPALPPPTTAKKATITSYFRVVPHLNSDSSSCADNRHPSSDISTGAMPSTSSPPSSPPPLASSSHSEKEARARRKPRRLTTKAKPRETSPTLGDDEGGTDNEAEEPATRSRRGQATATPKQGSENQAAATDREQDRKVLSSKTPSTLNREVPTTTPAPASVAASNPRKRQRTRAEPAMVQQTLSLSISETGFTECRECSMLYNPLHEKDRRFHARQHAAILKAREMKENNEEDD